MASSSTLVTYKMGTGIIVAACSAANGPDFGADRGHRGARYAPDAEDQRPQSHPLRGDHRLGRRDLPARYAARQGLAVHVQSRRGLGGRSDPRRIAGGRDDHVGDRCFPDGEAARHHPPAPRGGNARQCHRDLLGQDGDPDTEPDDRPDRVRGRFALRSDGSRICARGPASRAEWVRRRVERRAGGVSPCRSLVQRLDGRSGKRGVESSRRSDRSGPDRDGRQSRPPADARGIDAAPAGCHPLRVPAPVHGDAARRWRGTRSDRLLEGFLGSPLGKMPRNAERGGGGRAAGGRYGAPRGGDLGRAGSACWPWPASRVRQGPLH